MPSDPLMLIHDPDLLTQGERVLGPEFRSMHERVLRASELTSRLNVLPFDDDAGKAALFEQILGRPLPERVTIYPPFYTDHGLRLDLAERVFINQGCTFLDYAGIRLGEGVMVSPKATRKAKPSITAPTSVIFWLFSYVEMIKKKKAYLD